MNCIMRVLSGAAQLTVVVSFLFVIDVRAVTFTNLYIFSADNGGTNVDGVSPDSVVLSGNTLYGTTESGGLNGDGTVFRVDVDGQHFTNLFNFYRGTFDSGSGTYPDSTGMDPNPGLLLISNTLYGTTFYGGLLHAGTVFKINTDGSGFGLIKSFAFTNGQAPSSGLTLFNNALYGTTTGGGTNQSGTIFRIDLSGLGFSKLFDFDNNADTYGGVVVYSNALYGFARFGEPTFGYVYRYVPGGAMTHILDFDGTNASRPYSTPTLSGNTLFGISFQGGTNGAGNIFRLDTDGLHYTNLFSFDNNTAGASPVDLAGMVLVGNTLYGTASGSGSGGRGTVFQINTDGSGFAVLHSFQFSDGANPESLLVSNGTLYGMTQYGIHGSSLGNGAVYSIILQPSIKIALSGNHVVLSWNDPSFFLYNTPTVPNTFTKIIGAASPYNYTLTNNQRFFELRSN